jgi:hypothetical protein
VIFKNAYHGSGWYSCRLKQHYTFNGPEHGQSADDITAYREQRPRRQHKHDLPIPDTDVEEQ